MYKRQDVLSVFPDGIGGLGGCSMEDLREIDGIGPSKASSILAAVELGKRIAAAVPQQMCIRDRGRTVQCRR